MSSLPASALPTQIPDTIPHFCEYFILAFFFIQIFNRPTNRKTVAVGFICLIALGLLDELHQAWVPGRFCSLKDLLFDAFGSFSGLSAYLIWQHWAIKKAIKKSAH